tara:strand:- start:445 stop:3300 length:2856 start_codon:yes stop_codon:yes gene_type:complete
MDDSDQGSLPVHTAEVLEGRIRAGIHADDATAVRDSETSLTRGVDSKPPSTQDQPQRSEASTASPASPSIPALPLSTLLAHLGLSRTATFRFGVWRFSNAHVNGLANAVAAIADALAPADVDRPETLQPHIDALLDDFGKRIWGKDEEREWLVKASDGVQGYERDLVYEDREDCETIRRCLGAWIVWRAVNSFRYQKAKMQDLPARENVGERKLLRTDTPGLQNVAGPMAMLDLHNGTVEAEKGHGSVTELAGDVSTPGLLSVEDNVEPSVAPAAGFEPSPTEPVCVNQVIMDSLEEDANATEKPLTSLERDDRTLTFSPSVEQARESSVSVAPEDSETYLTQTLLPSKLHRVAEPSNLSGTLPTLGIVATPSLLIEQPGEEPSVNVPIQVDIEVTSKRAAEGSIIPLSGDGEATENLAEELGEMSVQSDPPPPADEHMDGAADPLQNGDSAGKKTYAALAIFADNDTSAAPGPLKDFIEKWNDQTKLGVNVVIKTPTNVLQSQSEAGPKKFIPRRKLPLNEYWTESDWRGFTLKTGVSITTLLSAIGLPIRRVITGVAVKHPIGTILSEEVNHLATTLYAQLSADDLVLAAADSSYLNDEIDALLDEYAPDIWGMDADRSRLLKPGTDHQYPKALVYEADEDRKLIWLHLHQWIFKRAFDELVKFGDTVEARERALDSLPLTSSDGAAWVVPDRFNGSASTTQQVELEATKSKLKVPVKGTFTTPPWDRHQAPSSIRQRNPSNTGTTQSPKRKAHAEGTLPLRVSSKRARLHDTNHATGRLLTHAFLAYLKDSASHTHNEPAHLDKISKELVALTPSLPKLLGGTLFSTSFQTVLDAWITYRNVVHRVHQRFASSTTSNATTSPIRTKVLHSRYLTQLRQARDAFLLANEDRELSNESIICMGFARLQESDEMSEQVESEVRYGLQILEERVIGLAEKLKVGGGAWVGMG